MTNRLTTRQLAKLTDTELEEIIYEHRTSSSITFGVFFVEDKHIDHEKFAKIFDIRPVVIKYLYEVVGIATPTDILRYLRVKHYEGAFGVGRIEHLIKKSKPLTREQIENLLGLGKSPSEIIVNCTTYNRRYKSNQIPQAESSLFD